MSLTYRVPINKVGAFERMLGISIKKEIEAAMKQAARQAKTVLVAKTKRAGAVASGKLQAGWDFEYSPTAMTVKVLNKVKHAGPVEYGVLATTRKLGPNALINLEAWVNQKLGVAGPKARKVAKAIKHAINQRQGWRFEPRHIVGDSPNRIAEIFNNRIQEALERARAKAAK